MQCKHQKALAGFNQRINFGEKQDWGMALKYINKSEN